MNQDHLLRPIRSPLSSPPRTLLRHEIALLLACTRRDIRGYEETIRRLLEQDLDWTVVLDVSQTHGVDAMLYNHLARVAPDSVPDGPLQTLQGRVNALLGYNLHCFRTLLRMVAVCEERGIPVLPVKGPILAKQYYGDLGLRRFVDMDVLVPRDAFAAAQSVLASLDFRPATQRTRNQIEQVLDAQVGVEWIRDRDRVFVELHTALLNKTLSLPLEVEQLWARRHTVQVGSTTLSTLAPDDLILYLCAHGTKHYWAKLKWISDVAQVAQTAALDWSALLARARRLDADRMLLLGLLLSSRWLDTPLPTEVQTAMAEEPTVHQLARTVEATWLFRPDGTDRTPGWDQFQYFFSSRRRWSSRGPLLLHYGTLALTPTEKDRIVALPDWLSGLYFLLRPIRLVRGHLRAKFRSGRDEMHPDRSAAFPSSGDGPVV